MFRFQTKTKTPKVGTKCRSRKEEKKGNTKQKAISPNQDVAETIGVSKS